MPSPFNEITTLLLSPMIAKDLVIFLYTAGEGDQSFVADYQTDYDVVAQLSVGTITIHTATVAAFDKIYDYISGLYGVCDVNEEVCLTWECPTVKCQS